MKNSPSCYELRLGLRGFSVALRIHPDRMFVPNLVSLLSAAVMRVEQGDVFCDVCSGSGLHAIVAAKLGARRPSEESGLPPRSRESGEPVMDVDFRIRRAAAADGKRKKV